ncbi:MAG: hypothetical protein R8K49_06025 [Mariprofundaceae bacterium]
MRTTEYNGWSNHETWEAMLWLEANENRYLSVRKDVLHALSDSCDYHRIAKVTRLVKEYTQGGGILYKGDHHKRVNHKEIAEFLIDFHTECQ